MWRYPTINPIALKLGPLAVHWYGLMYLLSFLVARTLGRHRSTSYRITLEKLDDIIFYCALGVIVGGRLGYMLFYDTAALWADPLRLFKIWQGGMSFHGGFLGVLIALMVLSCQLKKPFLELTDFIAPLIPLGLGAGRIGNFINGELGGRIMTHPWPWGIINPPWDLTLRHPSQLYEAFFEGLVFFVVLWTASSRPKPLGFISGLFLLYYGMIRILLEFFREPDIGCGFIMTYFTMGQLLSLPMVLLGLFMIKHAQHTAQHNR